VAINNPVLKGEAARSGVPGGFGLVDRSARVLDVAVFCGLLVLMIVAVIPYGSVDPWWEAVFECGVFSLAAVGCIEIFLSGKLRIKQLVVFLPLMLLTAFAFIQWVVWPAWLPLRGLTLQHTLTIDRYQTMLTARKALALTLFAAMLLQRASSEKRLRWLVRIVIAIGLGSALFAILRQVLQAPDSPSGFALPFLFYGVGYGQFVSPNAFSYIVEMPFGLLAGLILGGGVRRERILICLAIIIPIWTALVLSNSRGGLLAMIVQFAFVLAVALAWVARRRASFQDTAGARWIESITASRWVRALGVALVIVTLTFAVLWMGGESLNKKLESQNSITTEEGTDGNTRKEIWHASWDLFKQNPWTGVGFGTYFLGVTKYYVSSGRLRLETAHNDYLDLAANGGLIAIVLALWLAGSIVWRTAISLGSRDPYRRAAALGAAAAMLSVAVHSLVDFGLQLTGIAAVFAGVVVIAVADKKVLWAARDEHHDSSPTKRVIADKFSKKEQSGINWWRWFLLPLMLIGVFACYQFSRAAAATGVSRLYQTTAILGATSTPADQAVKVTPADPEAHYTLGLSLVNEQKLTQAADEFRLATSLRPSHYYEWLDLGVTLDRLGDQNGAFAALMESVRLAPSFAQPRWQLGNWFYRQGRFDEAFTAMRSAAQSNPNLFAGMLDLTWVATDGDVDSFLKIVTPKTSRNHFELAKFLATQRKGDPAAVEIQLAGAPRDQNSIDLWRQTVYTLISNRDFGAAYQAWATSRGDGGKGTYGIVLNPDFMEPIVKDDLGFGWQFPAIEGVSVSVDPTGPDSKSRSLLFNFNGNFVGDIRPLYQMVLVQPNSNYSLKFMARTEGLVSGGPPLLRVLDTSGPAARDLAASRQLSGDSAGWVENQLDFSTDQNASAVLITLQRVPCNQTPCPVFGKLWLSRFRLSKK